MDRPRMGQAVQPDDRVALPVSAVLSAMCGSQRDLPVVLSCIPDARVVQEVAGAMQELLAHPADTGCMQRAEQLLGLVAIKPVDGTVDPHVLVESCCRPMRRVWEQRYTGRLLTQDQVHHERQLGTLMDMACFMACARQLPGALGMVMVSPKQHRRSAWNHPDMAAWQKIQDDCSGDRTHRYPKDVVNRLRSATEEDWRWMATEPTVVSRSIRSGAAPDATALLDMVSSRCDALHVDSCYPGKSTWQVAQEAMGRLPADDLRRVAWMPLLCGNQMRDAADAGTMPVWRSSCTDAQLVSWMERAECPWLAARGCAWALALCPSDGTADAGRVAAVIAASASRYDRHVDIPTDTIGRVAGHMRDAVSLDMDGHMAAALSRRAMHLMPRTQMQALCSESDRIPIAGLAWHRRMPDHHGIPVEQRVASAGAGLAYIGEHMRGMIGFTEYSGSLQAHRTFMANCGAIIGPDLWHDGVTPEQRGVALERLIGTYGLPQSDVGGWLCQVLSSWGVRMSAPSMTDADRHALTVSTLHAPKRQHRIVTAMALATMDRQPAWLRSGLQAIAMEMAVSDGHIRGLVGPKSIWTNVLSQA